METKPTWDDKQQRWIDIMPYPKNTWWDRYYCAVWTYWAIYVLFAILLIEYRLTHGSPFLKKMLFVTGAVFIISCIVAIILIWRERNE